MRETQSYSGSQYARDGGFPLVGAIVRLFGKRASSGIAKEAEEQADRARKARQGKVIGKPAGNAAWIRKQETGIIVEEGKQDVGVTVRESKQDISVMVKESET